MPSGKILLRVFFIARYYGAVYAVVMALDAVLMHWQHRPFHASAASHRILWLMVTITPLNYFMQRPAVIRAITGRERLER